MDALMVQPTRCPRCDEAFGAFTPRPGSYQIISWDSDRCPCYQGTNPLFYHPWVCPRCRFAAYPEDFQHPVETFRRALSAFGDAPDLGVAMFALPRSLAGAIAAYRLAAHGYQAHPDREERLADVYLRLSWLYRMKRDAARERECQDQAIAWYERALEAGRPLLSELSASGARYLLGELELRLGRRERAKAHLVRALEDMRTAFGLVDLERLTQQRLYEIEAVDRRREALSRIDFLSPLATGDLDLLAEGMVEVAYPDGGVICRVGEPGNSLFIVQSGRAYVHPGDPGRLGPRIAALESGEFFGEMSLLTGEPRNATVVADPDTILLQVDQEAFGTVLLSNPQVMAQIAEVMDWRRAINMDLEQVGFELAAVRKEGDRPLLQRIRDFHGQS